MRFGWCTKCGMVPVKAAFDGISFNLLDGGLLKCTLLGGKCRATVKPWPEADVVYALVHGEVELPDPRLRPSIYKLKLEDFSVNATKALSAVMSMVAERNIEEGKYVGLTFNIK